MSDVCFSGSALVILGTAWTIISGVIVTLFGLLMKFMWSAIIRAQSKEDDALSKVYKAVDLGNVVTDVAEERLPRRRR